MSIPRQLSCDSTAYVTQKPTTLVQIQMNKCSTVFIGFFPRNIIRTLHLKYLKLVLYCFLQPWVHAIKCFQKIIKILAWLYCHFSFVSSAYRTVNVYAGGMSLACRWETSMHTWIFAYSHKQCSLLLTCEHWDKPIQIIQNALDAVDRIINIILYQLNKP